MFETSLRMASGIVPGMASNTDDAVKVRENRLRRMAERQGLKLVKSRRRDPRALGYGGFMLVDTATNSAVSGEIDSAQSLELDEVEAYLLQD